MACRLVKVDGNVFAVFTGGVPVGHVRRGPVAGMWIAEGFSGARGVFRDRRSATDWLALKEA